MGLLGGPRAPASGDWGPGSLTLACGGALPNPCWGLGCRRSDTSGCEGRGGVPVPASSELSVLPGSQRPSPQAWGSRPSGQARSHMPHRKGLTPWTPGWPVLGTVGTWPRAVGQHPRPGVLPSPKLTASACRKPAWAGPGVLGAAGMRQVSREAGEPGSGARAASLCPELRMTQPPASVPSTLP